MGVAGQNRFSAARSGLTLQMLRFLGESLPRWVGFAVVSLSLPPPFGWSFLN